MSLEKSDVECPATWIITQNWENIVKLAADFPGSFIELPDQIRENLDSWHEWFDSDQPESDEFPCGYSERLPPFHILMLLR